jgi:Divergent InlB B-repeat domain/FG-GAP repeat
MTARAWPISHLRASGLFGASVAIFAIILFSLQLALAQFTQQGVKLVGTGAVGNAQQGMSVAVSGDGNTAIIGGPADNSSPNKNAGAGVAWVFTQSNGVWRQQGKLVGTGAIGNAQQGISVALSDDGNTAIVGGPDDNSSAGNNSGTGGAWVFSRNASGVWTQQSKLVGTGAVGNAQHGISVALSGDGNTAIVGGPGDNSHAGAAWVFTRSGGVWTQQGTKLVGTGAVGAAQGWSVGLSEHGDTAVVGGPGDNSHAGAIWVFHRGDGVWSQQGSKLVGTSAVGKAQQGISVALSDDGDTAIVGGDGDNSNAGAAWVFTRSGGVWTQQGSKLVGTGAVGTAFQGASVTLSGDGNAVMVGGYGDNSNAGAAWVFTQSGGVWTQQGSKLVGTGAVGAAFQGSSVALSDDGNTGIVGGYGDNSNAGAAWVFVQLTSTQFQTATTASKTATTASNSSALVVTPFTNIVASGSQGGAFSPSTFNYKLTASKGSIGYSITNVPNWLTASSTSGTVAKSGTTITFSINSSANSLKSGTYTGNINFNNRSRLATLTINPAQHTVAVSASPSAGGTVSGGGTFGEASSRTVTANANSGYNFVNWTQNGSVVSTAASYTFTLNGNVTLVANFTTTQNTNTVSASPSSTISASSGTAGTVSASPGTAGTVSASPGTAGTVSASPGTAGTVSASPSTGGTVSASSSAGGTVSASPSAGGAVPAPLYMISVTASLSTGGAVNGGGLFAAGSSNTVTATANSGYNFVNWIQNGSVVSTAASYTFTLNGNVSPVANFALQAPTGLTLTPE